MKKEISLKLWDISNLIAGFSAAQTMAFLFFAIQGNGLTATLQQKCIQHYVAFGTFLGSIFYCLAIYLCYLGSESLLKTCSSWSEIRSVYIKATIGKISVVIFFEAITLFVIY